MKTRYAISSPEEIWVRVCSKFFETHGEYDWYKISQKQAFNEMMLSSKGTGNPRDIKKRIAALYKSVGIEEE
jgi:hypothetical protein